MYRDCKELGWSGSFDWGPRIEWFWSRDNGMATKCVCIYYEIGHTHTQNIHITNHVALKFRHNGHLSNASLMANSGQHLNAFYASYICTLLCATEHILRYAFRTKRTPRIFTVTQFVTHSHIHFKIILLCFLFRSLARSYIRPRSSLLLVALCCVVFTLSSSASLASVGFAGETKKVGASTLRFSTLSLCVRVSSVRKGKRETRCVFSRTYVSAKSLWICLYVLLLYSTNLVIIFLCTR